MQAIDRTARRNLEGVLRRILRDELTGWQIHDLTDPIAYSDDVAVETICWLIEICYAGWETRVTPLDDATRKVFQRVALFLTTDLPVLCSIEAFTTHKRRVFSSTQVDNDGFVKRVQDGTWPFASRKEMDEAQQSLARDFGTRAERGFLSA